MICMSRIIVFSQTKKKRKKTELVGVPCQPGNKHNTYDFVIIMRPDLIIATEYPIQTDDM